MRRSLSYVDAVRILGGGEHRLVKFLDRASTAGLLAAGGFNFFEARHEIVRLGGELVKGLSERLRGIDRLTRTERLLAAHTVIVITAYFDALGDALARLGPGSAELTAGDQISLAGGRPVEVNWRGLAHALTTASPVQPTPLRAHEHTLDLVCIHYTALGANVTKFISGLALWDELDETGRDKFVDLLGRAVPAAALGKYDEQFRRLATDCAEFGVWVGLTEHRATRDEVREVRAGLTELEQLLAGIATGRLPDARRDALSRAYQAALHRPITLGSEVSTSLRIPTLGEGYIDHRFRAAEVVPSSEPGRESWWDGVPPRTDLNRFLAAYLCSPQAYQGPLLVLGQPGSGKSVLTRVLAARLPASDFLPVRVELRQAPAEADLQDQIELAVRNATGESLSWPRLVESAGGALPVVFLDGFDELLQATGVTQTDFLVRVAAFQEREADQGRPVAVVVTSRVAVANRAGLPPEATALRLEPFDDGQVAAWLEIWHQCNGAALVERDLRALPTDVALMHRELAEQPLLLLMLALYDAHANVLQRRTGDGELSSTELYERLLADFAGREVGKRPGGLTAAELERAVETELLRLSVVAFAMFNRRSQWIDEAGLNADLAALLGDRTDAHHPGAMRTPLTAAQIMVGRFFFVHEAQATRDGARLQTYEFLHATFGEFLVARLIVQILTDLVNRETAAAYALPTGIDDGLLHALLSFAGLAARAPVVTFLRDLIERLTAEQRAAMSDILLRLHHRALDPRAESAHAAYEPSRLTMSKRLAEWSANLVLLTTLVSGEVTASLLFPDAAAQDEAAFAWRDEAMMWRSQLTSEEWSGLISVIAMERFWIGDRREVRLWPDDGTFVPAPVDMYWTYIVAPDDPTRGDPTGWLGHTPVMLDRKSNFTTGKTADVMTHALQPIGEVFPTIANQLVPVAPGRLASPTHGLLAALVAPFGDGAAPSVYSDLVRLVRHVVQTTADDSEILAFVKMATAVSLTAAEHGAISSEALGELLSIVGELRPTALGDLDLSQLHNRLIDEYRRVEESQSTDQTAHIPHPTVPQPHF